MSNAIKYSTSTPDHSLHKGNVAVGVNSVNMGPTLSTGWYAGKTPSGNYIIYKTSPSGPPNTFAPQSDQELYRFVTMQGGSANDITSVGAALAWIATQSDLLALHSSLPNIVTDGLVLALDAGNVSSYPTTGTTWYDVCGQGNNGTLTNGPTFNSNGAIDFDGTDDSVVIPNSTANNINDNFTFSILVKSSTWTSGNQEGLVQKGAISNYGAYLRGRGGTVSFYTSPNSYWAPGPNIGGDGRWHFLTFVYSYSQLGYKQVYTDGSYISQLAVTVPITSNTSDIQIGFAGVAAPKYLNADVANYKLYNKVLTLPEILQNYYQAPIVTDGLVFAVDAGNLVSYENGDTTTNSLTDSSTGTLTNGVGFDNANGGTWNFDGTNDYISFPDNTDLNSQSITMESWSKLDTVFQNAFLFEKGRVNTQYSNFYNGNGTFYFRTMGLSSQDLTFYYPSYVNTSTWNHIVCTYASGIKTIYYNGVVVAQATGITGTISTNTQMYIGAYGRGSSYFMNGKIAVSRVYNKALTADEVQQNFQAQSSRFI